MACFHVVLVTTGHRCSQGREGGRPAGHGRPRVRGGTVPMTAPCREMRQAVTRAVKKKHRWGECLRDRKESTHVEDRGRREVRAGRAGQRAGDEMRLCGG